MSNLVAAPGQSPDFDPRNVQTVRVRDLGATEIGNTDDEIDLRELWRALQRRKKLVAVTAGGVILLSALFTTYQRIFRPVYEGAFSLLIPDPISNEGERPPRPLPPLLNQLHTDPKRAVVAAPPQV